MKYIEQYITYDEYVDKYLDKEKPYEGFIIGYGYAYFTYGLSMPTHLYGYNPTTSNPSLDESHHNVFLQQIEECTLETVKLSYRGLFKDSVAEYIVKPGDTLGMIAYLFDVTVDDLVKWNNITNADTIVVGQKIVINKQENSISEIGKTVLEISDISVSTLDIYWNNISKKIMQKRAYQIQKLLKKYLKKTVKTRDIKSLIGQKIGKVGHRLGIVGLGVNAYEFCTAENLQDKIDSGFSFVIGALGFTGYGAPVALYWSCGGEWLHKNWRDKVLSKQIEWGIEGYASVMPFK